MNKKSDKNTQKLLFFEEVGKLQRFGAKIQPKKVLHKSGLLSRP